MSEPQRDTLEELLRHSSPRPAPGAVHAATARAELRREWRAMSGRRRTRRSLLASGMAAALLVGFFAAFVTLQPPAHSPVPVASIEKTVGTVYLLGENSELRPTESLATVLSGQTVVTGHNAGLAIAWGKGGLIRIDEDTRIRFTDSETAFLEEGRVYFDSIYGLSAGADGADAPVFSLETEHGVIRHLGTQYMAAIDRNALVVSVREGEVLVDGRFHEQRVDAGQQAMLSGSRRPTILGISRSGEQWAWISRTTPGTDVDGRTLREFLDWASREMGLELRFEGAAESIAREAVLRGTIDMPPMDALRLRLATSALEWRLDEGVIYISD